MIVRESPTPSKSKPDSSWPPKSPHEAALISPSGRKRLQRTLDRSSTSPSPVKRPRPNSQRDASYRPLRDAPGSGDDDEGEEEDEDEETLRLKLKAIKTQLKLRSILKKQSKNALDTAAGPREAALSQKGRLGILNKQASTTSVEVPLSPKRVQRPVQPPESPRRVILGIDKGLKATNVSLKKAISGKEEKHHTLPAAGTSSKGITHKPKSFNERLAESRSQDNEHNRKQKQIARTRSTGFGVNGSTDGIETSSTSFRIKRASGAQANTDQVAAKGGRTDLTANCTTNGARSDVQPDRAFSKFVLPTPVLLEVNDHSTPSKTFAQPRDDCYEVENYSRFTLSKRLLDCATLDGAFQGKTLLTIPHLLKEVTGPDYEAPDIETDYVVLGIIASKSSPHSHAVTHKMTSSDDADNARSKFMVLHLTDLQWELDLFLFDTGFEAFWKLTVGTVIAVLNPAIMPPKPHLRDTGRFSLKLCSCEDTVLEIGMAKDLGFCKSVRKDGKECGQWVDARKTEFCDFHVSLQVDKAKAGRMEINTMSTVGLFGPNAEAKRGRGATSSRWRQGRKETVKEHGRENGLLQEGQYYDRISNEIAYSIPKEFSSNRTTSSLLDAEDYVHGGLSKGERKQKRRAEQEKERTLAKQLAAVGGGLGSEYMRLKQSDAAGVRNVVKHRSGISDGTESADAAKLGLLGGMKAAVTLSPVKGGKFKAESSKGQAVGWAGAFRRGLPGSDRAASRDKPSEGVDEPKEASATKKAKTAVAKYPIGTCRPVVPAELVIAKASALDDNDEDDLDIV